MVQAYSKSSMENFSSSEADEEGKKNKCEIITVVHSNLNIDRFQFFVFILDLNVLLFCRFRDTISR